MGGDEEDRTPDLGSAIAALSQLSYTPMNGTMIAYCGNIVKGLLANFWGCLRVMYGDKGIPLRVPWKLYGEEKALCNWKTTPTF